MNQSTLPSSLKTHSVLPDNRSPLERALELSLSQQLFSINHSYPVLLNPQKTPVSALPYLAADKQVAEWSPDDSEGDRRATADNQWRVFKLSGTVAGLRLALSGFNGETEIQPWHEYGGQPYHLKAKVWVTAPIDGETINRLSHRVNNAKSERDTVLLSVGAKTETKLNFALTTVSGPSVTVDPYIVTELSSGGEIHITTALSAAAITTVSPYSISELHANGQYTIGVSAVCTPINLVEAYNA